MVLGKKTVHGSRSNLPLKAALKIASLIVVVLLMAACTNALLTEVQKTRESAVSPKLGITIKDGAAISNAGTYDFLEVGVAETAEVVFVIANTGVTELSITANSTLITGADPALFSFGTPLPATLAPNGSAEFSIKFLPGTIGAKNAEVSFSSNDVDNTTFQLIIKGAGVDQVAAPVFENGTFQCYPNGPFNIKITCSNASANIYYTTNGSDPSVDRLGVGTTLYSNTGIDMSPISATVYIKAMAKMDGLKDSTVVMATISKDEVKVPTLSLSANTTFGPETVFPAITIVSDTGNAGIFYTVDGSDPALSTSTRVSLANGASFTYSGAHAGGEFTLMAVAFITGAPASLPVMATYYFKQSTPIFATVQPQSAYYASAQTVTLSCSGGGSMHYATDSSILSTSVGTDYPGSGIEAPIGGAGTSLVTTIRAIAFQTNWQDSDVLTGTFPVCGPGRWYNTTGVGIEYSESKWDQATWQ